MSLVSTKRRNEGVKYEGETFINLDLRSMKAFGSTFERCQFVSCEMDLTDFRNSRFAGCSFRASTMRLVDFSASFVEDTEFLACDLEQASFSGCHLRGVLFNECRMAYGERLFQDATAKGRMDLVNSNLHGSSLDFREVEPGVLRFDGCNLWGAKLAMGCAVWNAAFDERAVKQFLALVARVSHDPRLIELAGAQYPVVCRAMDGRGKSVSTGTPVMEHMEVG